MLERYGEGEQASIVARGPQCAAEPAILPSDPGFREFQEARVRPKGTGESPLTYAFPSSREP